MPKFRCPRCGAIVEGLHDRCPRCNVLFKYRKEDMDLLTPYKAPVVEEPERIDEKPAEEPLPSPAPEAASVEEIKAEEPAKEEPVVEETAEPAKIMVPARIENKKAKKGKKELTPEQRMKAAKGAFKFGLLGFIFALLHTLWYVMGWIPIANFFVLVIDVVFLGFPILLSFVFGLLGFIFSVIALSKAKKGKGYKGSKGGKVFGIIGLVLSILFFFIPIIVSIVMIVLGIGVGILAVIGGIVAYLLDPSIFEVSALALLLLL